MKPFLHSRSSWTASESRRQGTVLVVALVCLLVVMGLLGAMLQGALRAHRKLHTERDLRQTELLLQAGCDRAAYQLTRETNYKGEIWNLPAAEVTGKGDGRVTIEILSDEAQATRRARVMAEYPLGGETSIRRTRTFRTVNNMP